MNGNKFLFLLVFVLVFHCTNSLVSVHLKPLEGEEIQKLYQHEIGTFITRVKNEGEQVLPKISLRWDVDPDLVIVEGLRTSRYRVTTVENLVPGEERLIELKIKPVIVKQGLEGTNKVVSVSYGVESYDYYSGTYVKVIKSPLKIDASLSNKIIKPGGASEVKLSLKNVSQKEIKINSARLVLPLYFFAKPGSELGETVLAPEQEIVNKNLRFSAEPSFIGTGKLVLRIEFEDELGKHVIDKDFSIESRGVDYGLFALIGIIIVLIIAVIYSKKKQVKKQS